MRHLRPITHAELQELWGMPVPLPIPARDKKLYLRVKPDGTIHPKGGGSYVYEGKLKQTDVILEPYSTIKR